MEQENQRLWNQFIKLGDMMGDGLHYEEPWIAKEYRKLSKILCPESHKIIREEKGRAVDKKMAELISGKKCECGGSLTQARRGSKVAYCICGKRYKMGKPKNK